MKQDVVSIIIPIYNVAEYLDRCVASACNQTYPHLQIILVDDGSPDNCPQMCDAWAAKDSRIQVIHKENGGLSDARNAGLDVAIGKYIYFLDSDDYIEHTLVETVLRHMEDGVDMVNFPCLTHRMNGTTKISSYQIGKFHLPDGKSRADFIVDTLLQYKIGWEAWKQMYVRENIEKYGLRFVDNKEIFAEDMYFCLCYCAHAQQVVCIPDVLYHYILRENSIMGKSAQKHNVDRMNQLAIHLKEYYQKTGVRKELLDIFPVIHYYIVCNALERARNNGILNGKAGRKKLISDITDIRFFRKNMRCAIKNFRRLERNDHGRGLADKLNYLQYILDGCYPTFALRSRYLSYCSKRIDERFGYMADRKRSADILSKEHYDIYIIGTEDFGNIGDHQIARAIWAFIRRHCPNKSVKEVSASMYPYYRDALKKSVRPGALIVLTGGGNFGDIYPVAQDIRQDAIETWKSNYKIVFPQTIHFSDTDKGEKYLTKAKETYTADNNVILATREKTSYSFAKNNFTCQCILAPDIVLYECHQEFKKQDNSVLLVLRSDKEKVFDGDPDAFSVLNDWSVRRLDHQLNQNIPLERREETVEWVMEQYRKVDLVITDRLHGLIFSVVTGTPCVAFSSYDHKIPGTYQWLSQVPYVCLVETQDEAEIVIEKLLKMGKQVYDPSLLEPYFEELAQVVRKYANN